MTPERYQKIVDVLNHRQHDLTLLLDEVHKGRNLSAIIRSADAHGIDTVHSVNPRAGFQHYRGTALGSHKWVDVKRYDRVEEAAYLLKNQGFQLVAAHLSDTAIHYRDIDYTVPTAIILGTEKQGVSDAAVQLADHHAIIPMRGMVASFNVSVACGILLAEIQHQRETSQSYQHQRLPQALYQQRLFHWCQPTLAEFCDARQLPYPPLDSEGEVIDGATWYRSTREHESS